MYKKIMSFLFALLFIFIGTFSSIKSPVFAAKKQQKISIDNFYYIKKIGDKDFNLNAKAKTKLTYKSSDKNIVTVSKNGKVTLKNVGNATIAIKAASSKQYKSANIEVDIYVASVKSHKNILSIILNDGTVINSDEKTLIPLSKLKDATFKITNAEKGMSYLYAQFLTVTKYLVEQDPEPNWAYNGIALDMTNSKLVNEWSHRYEDYFDVVDVKNAIHLCDINKNDEYCNIYIALQEINPDGTDGNYYYEYNFLIDKEK